MIRLVTLHILISLLVIVSSGKYFNNYWTQINRDPNDDRMETSSSSTEISKLKPMSFKRNQLLFGSVQCDDSRRCGCYKGHCWAYIDENQTSETGWWCFTQREGIRGMQKSWAKCTNNTQCSWSMTCGDCWTWVGRRTGIKTDKILC